MCSTELLVRSQRDAQPVNAIQEEQRDFVAAVRTGRPPRVDGAAGRDAIAVAEMILERIEEHAWDGTRRPARRVRDAGAADHRRHDATERRSSRASSGGLSY